MKKLLFISLVINTALYVQNVQVMRFEQFETLTNPKDDKVYIFNFWATYCKPCLKEMPDFQRVAAESKGKIEVVFVSLDFVKDRDKVEAFIKEKNIKEKVILLNEPDYDSWINKVNKDWSGAIPATLIIRQNKREFYEKSLDYEEIKRNLNGFE